jgi:hypothetical protein
MNLTLHGRYGILYRYALFIRSAFIAAVLVLPDPTISIVGSTQAASDTVSNTLPAVACLVVDSDSNLDDLRAIAIIATQRRVAVVVATDGILPADEGASTLARFLAGASSRTLIIRGQSRFASSPLPTFAWLPEVRKEAERLENELAQIIPTRLPILTPATSTQLGEAVAVATRDCPTLGVLMIGPWSSFVAYQDAIRERLRFIVIQGQPPNDPADPSWDGVNCQFDSQACQIALQRLQGLSVSWVNLARNAPFPLDQSMINRLGASPLAHALRNVMQTDTSWKNQQLWDDSAAIFIMHPNAFKRVGEHLEPAISPVEMRNLEVELANGKAP